MAQAILNRIANGEESAVADCLKTYGGLVWSLARRMLRNPADAEDVVQEIFVDIWKNAERFDPAQSSETTFVAISRGGGSSTDQIFGETQSPDSPEDVMAETRERRGQYFADVWSRRMRPAKASHLSGRSISRFCNSRSSTVFRIRRSRRDRDAAGNCQNTCAARICASREILGLGE